MPNLTRNPYVFDVIVVGAGHAGKEQVQFMVKRLLPACGVTQADAADALACAIAHAHSAPPRRMVVVG